MRILMVDDSEILLQETRRAFWQAHRSWEVLLAATGDDALKILARDPVDLVITGLGLPDMDGADLIHRVREMQPAAVRIALADHPMAEWIEKAEGDLHRLFIKPLDAEFLVKVVESLDAEDDSERQGAIGAFVSGLSKIPSLPTLYTELVALLEREDAGMGEVARLIRKDVAVAAQVLRSANSVHSASNRPVSELGQAVALLGMDSLRALVLFRGLVSGSEAKPQGLDLEKLWLHSFEVAAGTRQLAALEGETRLADLAFSVGLLHDIGLVVLALDPSNGYRSLLERAQSSRMPLAVLEQETYGVDHTQVGAHLLRLWGLPPAFCRPVREHHAPPATAEGFPLSQALHLADARHGGGRSAGIFADGRWGLHPHLLADPARFARWKACLAMDGALGTS
ncbi:response regulator [Geothrix sp. 21YS21S-4]|uniref:response regulator n=1 Tax=Geothrix sp. 21YS21S-4 TaxID=3068889 RepID=UPI0027B9126D|nr:response regulator [Geothrix sp. 21YS21S-4]